MNKTGTARDIMLIAVIFFGLAIAVFVLYYFSQTSVDQMLDVPVINDSAPTRSALNALSDTSLRFDYLMLGLFIGLTLGVMIGGWLVGGHPIFMFIYFMVVLVAVAASAVFANVWESVSQASVFGASISAFPITNHILSYFPMYIAIIGILGLIVMFAKPFVSGDG